MSIKSIVLLSACASNAGARVAAGQTVTVGNGADEINLDSAQLLIRTGSAQAFDAVADTTADEDAAEKEAAEPAKSNDADKAAEKTGITRQTQAR